MNLLIVTQKVDENDQLLGFFIEWIKRFSQKFGKVTVLCLQGGEHHLPSNVDVIVIGKYRGLLKPLYLFRFYYLITNLRRKYDAVFVHMNPIWMAIGGPLWGLMKKSRFIWYTTKGLTLKLKIAEKFADKIFTASRESFRLKSNKLVVTGHGIDTELFKPGNKKADQNSILSVGRISPVKNYEVLVDAAKILKERGLDFKVTMTGEPALEEDKRYQEVLKLKIKNLGLENNFDFIGKVNHQDLANYYQTHNLFVHLSKTGSLDKTILEAMACGMKVLSSNDASRGFLNSELIFDENNAEELAEKIEATVSRDLGNELRQYVIDNHNLDNLISKIFKECAAEDIIVYPFPYSSKSNRYIDLLYSRINNKQEVKNFWQLLSKRPGIIHIHWTNVIYGSRFIFKTMFLMLWNFLVLALLKVKGFKIIWTKHNFYPHDSRWIWLDKTGQKILFNMSDAITVHQKGEAKNKKVLFIPHGNYIDAYGPMEPKKSQNNDITLISLGATKPYKKIENIIKAFNEANAAHAKLIIAGKCDKGYAEKLKTFINNNVNIELDCDFVPDDKIPGYLADADYSIFWYDDSVLTSGGMVLSLSYGVPVIARNISATDLVKNGENGFLFNNEHELAEIIKKLPHMPKLDRNKVQDSVRDLNWDRVSKEFKELYRLIWKN